MVWRSVHIQRTLLCINETATGALKPIHKEWNTIALHGNDATSSIIFMKCGHKIPSRVCQDLTLKILNCHLLCSTASVDDVCRESTDNNSLIKWEYEWI